MSYQEVEKLVKRWTGEKILSDQKIQQMVVEKALEISQDWQDEVNLINQKIEQEVKISPTVEIYNEEAKEILLFDDGILVKGQKNTRSPHKKSVFTEDSTFSSSKKRVLTDVVL
jgi:hypothetical protein